MTALHKLFSWLVTIPFLPLFFGTFLIYHPALQIAVAISKAAFWRTYAVMNGTFLWWLWLFCGTRYCFAERVTFAHDRPVLFISNHQSIFDVPLFSWVLRKYRPVFVSKKELGKGIPSASLSLRAMGAALIDRKDRHQALEAISDLASEVKGGKRSGIVLFPEGTRARDGKMKRFKRAGFERILDELQELTIVPVAITGSYRLMESSLFPVPFGVRVSFTTLEPIEVTRTSRPALGEIEARIREVVEGEKNAEVVSKANAPLEARRAS